MALDARKRQKKAERRKKKERANRKALVSKKAQSWKERLQRAAHAPVLHCARFGTDGMHQVLLSRETPHGMVAYTVLLVDTWCLGVKSAFFGMGPVGDYTDQIYERFCSQDSVKTMTPESARKFVEGAVEYAQRLGLSPHADYATAHVLFGDIDASASTEVFQYGKDGKPYYFAGPNDPQWKSKAILNTLMETCGEENFHFTIPMAPDGLGGLGLADENGEAIIDEWYEKDELDDEDDFVDEDDIDEEVSAGARVIDVEHRKP